MTHRRERGLSLVELLVGAAVGLIVVAAAGSVVAAQHGAASGVRRGDEPVVVNPHAEIAPASAAAGVVAFSFSTGAGDAMSVADNERFAFRLRNGAIEMQLGARNWQALSDPGTVVVTAFSVVPRVEEADLATFCARPCAAASPSCPPRLQIRSFAISVAGRSAIDAGVTRELRSAVRVRNDAVIGSCEA